MGLATELAYDIPRPNLNPIHIGWAGGILNTVDKQSVDSWLDGFVDEVRISKVVRNFAGPPLVTTTSVLANQPTTSPSYQTRSKIQPFTRGATIAQVWLHYFSTKWDSVAMTGTGTDYAGSIPGQPLGTKVKYYVSATDNQGLRSVDPQNAEAATNPGSFSFTVYQPNVQLVYLTFDEGPGQKPVDHSPNPKIVVLPGRLPDYSADAKQGAYSLRLTANLSLPPHRRQVRHQLGRGGLPVPGLARFQPGCLAEA